LETTLDIGLSPRAQPVYAQLKTFIAERIAPLEREYYAAVAQDRWSYSARQLEILEGLKATAKREGLWNLFLSSNPQMGGVSNVDYAHLAELMGHSALAPEVFNCSSPDSGNIEVLERFGTPAQKSRWLQPLLDGSIRSAFAMTEPAVASSDASNIATRAELRDGCWHIDGEKHYITGAGDPRCEILIVVAVTDPEVADRHKRQSQILVPRATPGVEIVRPMTVFGHDDAPRGRMHIRFNDVRVPEENIILGRGRGFEVAQGRLGPGRIHHCMRAIGVAEKALELMCRRALGRTAFGKPLAALGGNGERIADSRIELDMARLLTLQTAHLMDTIGPKEARAAISAAKVAVPNIVAKIIDRAIQIHGAAGMSQDFPLAGMWLMQRALRFIDGPDEVHRAVIAMAELNKYR
jgi:acyl-CoA dehydrogenase